MDLNPFGFSPTRKMIVLLSFWGSLEIKLKKKRYSIVFFLDLALEKWDYLR